MFASQADSDLAASFGIHTPVPHQGRPTSKAAAVAIEPHVARLDALVLASLLRDGPATRDELQVRLEMDCNTLIPRVWTLIKQGLARETDLHRKTRKGRNAVVVEAV